MKKWNILILIVLICTFILFELLFIGYTIDDSFIFFRFAENFAGGEGLVYNHGERVDAATSVPWAVLLGYSVKLGIDPLLSSKVLGMMFGVGIILLLYNMGKLLNKKGVYNFISITFLISQVSFIVYGISGMETLMFSFFLLLAVYFYILHTSYNRRKYWFCILFVIVAMIRPEGMAFWGITFIHYSIKSYTQKRNIKDILKIALIFSVAYVPFILFKLFYYGTILPNTYLAKAGGPLLLRLIYGSSYVLRFYNSAMIIFLFLVFISLCLKFDFERSYLASIFFGGIMSIMYVGGDVFPYFRMFVPILPIALLLSEDSIINISSRLRYKHIFIVLVVLSIVGASLYQTSRTWERLYGFTGEDYQFTYKLSAGNWESYIEVADWISENTDEDEKILLQDVGVIPYLTKRYIIDIIGLTDKHLATIYYKHNYVDYYRPFLDGDRIKAVDKKVSDYVFEVQKPEIIIYQLNSGDPDDLSESFHFHELYSDPRFQQYEREKVFYYGNGQASMAIYKKNSEE